jgi:hypothetical protein
VQDRLSPLLASPTTRMPLSLEEPEARCSIRNLVLRDDDRYL